MGKITNTTDEVAKNPEGLLAEIICGGGAGAAIERMEARGQQELVNSELLPVKGSNDPAFAEMGIVFGDPVPGDKLFRKATLPAGWKLQASDHSMWSHLFDETGKKRAAIFYKAASYDRDAFIRPA